MGLVFWLVVSPLIAALFILVLPKMSPGIHRGLAFLGAIVPFVMGLIAWEQFNFNQSGYQFATSLNWFTFPNMWANQNLVIGLSFGLDGLSLPLILLTTIVAFLAVLGASRKTERSKEYFFWISLVTTGLLGVFTGMDMFTFFVALELVLFSTFFLIYIFGEEGRQKAAFKFLIYRGFATVALLVAFLGIAYGVAGGFAPGALTNAQGQLTGILSFQLPSLTGTAPTIAAAQFPTWIRSALFLVLLLAVFIEEAFVPFHTWLPTAHEYSDTPTNMLLGGVVTKTGAYILLRFGVGLLPDQLQHWAGLIAVFGVINILYGAFAAWAQKDWRRLIAFGSISHMGLVLLGIAAYNAAGLQGAMFMMISSGLLTALLFYLTGAIKERTSTIQIPALGGLSKSMPILSGFLLVAALGSLGLPLTSGFISEIQSFIGGFESFPAVSFIAVIGIILSAVYLLYAMQRTTFGPTGQGYLGLADARPMEYIPMVVLTAIIILIGIYPDVLGSLFGLSAHALLR